jgi:YHS domain-containing protein
MMAKDPVCGMMVDEARARSSSAHGGRTYFFCAPACKQRFDADPARFAR